MDKDGTAGESEYTALYGKKYDSASLQMIMQEQDKTLDAISGTLSTLQQQAGLMGTEITEHVE